MGEDSDTVLSGLQSLFELHGAPLVLKSDNGGAFAKSRVQACWPRKTCCISSRRRTTRATMALASGASAELKSRAKYLAELNLRPQAWSSSDLQRAVHRQRNHRPWGWTKPTRAEVWNARKPVTDEQRKNLAELREAKLGPNRTVADEVRDQANTLEAAFRPGAGGRSTPAPGSGQSAPKLCRSTSWPVWSVRQSPTRWNNSVFCRTGGGNLHRPLNSISCKELAQGTHA
jgi:hypothetical protein